MSKYFTIKGIEEDEIFRNLFIDYYPSLISFALYYVGDKTIAGTGSICEALGNPGTLECCR